MAKKKSSQSNGFNCGPMGSCKIETMLSIDERGQMVIPKTIREKAGIKAGDKLALINWEQEGETACIVLIKADKLTDMVQRFLGPMFTDGSNK